MSTAPRSSWNSRNSRTARNVFEHSNVVSAPLHRWLVLGIIIINSGILLSCVTVAALLEGFLSLSVVYW